MAVMTKETKTSKPDWNNFLSTYMGMYGGSVRLCFEQFVKQFTPKQCPKCGKFVSIVASWRGDRPPGIYCEACDWKMDLPEPVPKYCAIEEWVPRTILNLIEEFPQNPSVRATLNAFAREPIPAGLVKFEDIKNWFEHLYDPQMLQGRRVTNRDHAEDHIDRITLSVRHSRSIYGRCSFSAREVGYGNIDVGIPEVLRVLRSHRDAGRNLREHPHEIVRDILELLRDSLQEGFFDTEMQDENTEDHETEGGEAMSIRAQSIDTTLDVLREMLHRHDRDLYNAMT